MRSRSMIAILGWLALSLSSGGCEPKTSIEPSPAAQRSNGPTAAEAPAPTSSDTALRPEAPPTPPVAPPQTDAPAVEPMAPEAPRYAEVDWPHVRIDLNEKAVEIDGVCAINSGWLEQIICSAGTRTHESLVATEAKPSHIHAALLLIGLEPGKPGWWKIDPDDPEGRKWIVQPPTGARVSITFEWTGADGTARSALAREWVRDFHTHDLLPEGPWIFGGSMMKPDYSGAVTYVADRTGSIAGLVTFGDELLGWCEVLPDQEAVMAPEWEANTEAMPEPGTRVTVLLKPVK